MLLAILLATCLPEVLGGQAQSAEVLAVLDELVATHDDVLASRDASILSRGNTTALILQSFKKQNLALGLTFINVAFVTIYVFIISLCALITKIREYNEKKKQEMFEMFEQKQKEQKRETQRDSRPRRRSEPRVAEPRVAASLA